LAISFYVFSEQYIYWLITFVHVPTLPRVALCVQHLTFAQLGVVLTEERFIYVPLEPRQKPVSSNATIRLLQVQTYQGALYPEVSRHVYILCIGFLAHT
jgi:hypothetical protein